MAFLKDEEKQLLLDHYDDIEWFDDVTQQQCVRCHRVVINHYVSNCQHLFCDHCKKEWENGGQLKCPQCQECVTKLDDQDFDVEVKIHQLKMYCPNKKYGCKYADQLRKIPLHWMTCKDIREKGFPVETQVTNTLDDVLKQLTNLNETVGFLSGKFEEKLNQLERKTEYLDSKINLLTDRMTSGDKKVEVRSLKSEYTDESHTIKSPLKSINEQNGSLLQQTMEQMRVKMASMTLEIEALKDKKSEEFKPMEAETYDWTIQYVSENIQKDHWEFHTRSFSFADRYKIRAVLYQPDGKPVIYLRFEGGYDFKSFFIDKQYTTIEYIVRDQGGILTKERDIIRQSFQSIRWDSSTTIFRCVLPDEILRPPFLKNDCIKITISLKYPSIAHNFISNDGILMWKVDKYSKRKQEQLYHETWSPTFYTSPRGYRVKLQLLIDSSQVFVHFLAGEYNNSFSRAFNHTTTVTLINQSDPSKNSVKSVYRKDALVNIYAIELESSELIEANGFIKDDSLLLKVVIEPVEINGPYR